MKHSNLEAMLAALKENRIDFGRFVLETRKEYRAMAEYLLRRWTPPEWFTAEDVEQEMYLDTWRKYYDGDGGKVRFPKYRPEGATLVRVIVYGAMCAAKRELHRARGAKLSGSPDRNPSRHETPASALWDDGGDRLVDMILAQPPRAEVELIDWQEKRLARAKALEACKNKMERCVVLAIREAGSLDGASRVLYEDPSLREELGLESEKQAEKFVSKHAREVARRLVPVRRKKMAEANGAHSASNRFDAE